MNKIQKDKFKENNNKYVQMKQSRLNQKSYGSQNSDVLSLTSNNSDIVVNDSKNQLQHFKQKISHLLGSHQTQSLEDIYSLVKEKVGNNLIEQTSKQLQDMEAALGRVKKNNRQMAKLVTKMGSKNKKSIQNLTNQDSIIKKIQEKPNHNESSDISSSQQFYNYQYKNFKKNQNLSKSKQHLNKEKQHSNFQSNQKQGKNRNQKQDNKGINNFPKVSQSFEEEYKWKNRIYEQKVKETLMQLGNIKKEFHQNQPFFSNTQTNQTKNSFAQRLNNPLTKKSIQYQAQSIQMALNPKTAVSQEIKISNVNNESQKKINLHDRKQSYKNSFETSNSDSAKKVMNKEINTNKGNIFLMQKAKSISKRLEEIKAQLIQTTSRTPFHSIIQAGQQKSNIEMLASDNFHSPNNDLQNFKKFKLQKHPMQSIQQNIFEKIQKQEKKNQRNQVSIQSLQQQPLPQHKLINKKSILDEMKNVESKVLITENSLQQSFKKTSAKNNKSFETPNFSTFYHNHHSNQLQSRSLSKENSSNSFKKPLSSKPVIISYSVLNPSNSLKNVAHNTSIMNFRPPINTINKPQSVSFNTSHPQNLAFVGPYETSHVFPVTKFNKHKIFQNQHLNRSPSFNQLQYPPLIIKNPSPQRLAPLIPNSRTNLRFGRSVSEQKLVSNSFISTQKSIPKIVTSPGIAITNLNDSSKVAPYQVMLGSSSKNFRKSNSSKDSKDLTKSKGIGVSSKQKL